MPDSAPRPSNEESRHLARPDTHPKIPEERIGVLLINLGTPEAPTRSAVRKYLAEFLSDERIVDLPRAVWLPVLYGVILNVRPSITARNYKKVWRTESDESPLRYFTRQQAELLSREIAHDGIIIDWAMRYGSPSIKNRLDALKESGCTKIVVIPLYPQYSATTTASVHDAVFDAARQMRWQPALRFAPAFHDHPSYIDALASITQKKISALSWTPERIVLSFHGIPERYFMSGDPYHCHCQKTARLLRTKMGWADDFAPLAFQSKFGREKWLEPATDQMIENLAKDGVKNIAVIMPGFVADCIETLEEIDIVARASFVDAGGENFAAIPCLNDSPEMIGLLKDITESETGGWIEPSR